MLHAVNCFDVTLSVIVKINLYRHISADDTIRRNAALTDRAIQYCGCIFFFISFSFLQVTFLYFLEFYALLSLGT